MKKLVLSAAAIVVAAALIGPKVVSSQFAQGIENTVATINDIPGYEASVTSIDSGWFSTSAVVNVAVKMPNMEELGQEALDISANFSVNGNHGPFITEGGFSLSWLRTHISSINAELPLGLSIQEDAPIYEVIAYTSLFGGTQYTDKLAALEYVDTDTQATINFAGMQGEGEFSGSGIVASSESGAFSATIGDAFSLDMSNLSIEIDAQGSWTQMIEQGMYDSIAKMSINDIQINDNMNGTQTSVQNTSLDMVSVFDEESGLGDFEVVTKIANIDASELNLSELVMAIQVNNLESAFVKAYQEYSTEMIDQASDPQAVLAATQAFFENNLLTQLQAEPEYNITDLSGKINGSSFNGKALSKIVGVTALPQTMEDPNFWMQHAQIDSKITMQTAAANYIATQVISAQMAANPQFAQMAPEDQASLLAQQVPPTLNALVQQGMLVATDDGYEMVFTMQNREAILNGMPIPL